MKRTLTINLGGIVFNIDEDAFVVLKGYLDTIKGYFSTSEGRDEIMTDIEGRIAEMLQEKLNNGKQVINTSDINEVITIMGQPEDYITEDMDEAPKSSTTGSSQHRTYTTYQQPRKLFRDPDGNILGGVCSGIGYYFGIDPIWIRLAFVIAVFAGFSGILVYIILWIIMPEARTSSEKLAMRGEPVTFENIGKTVEEEIEKVKKKLNNLDKDHIKEQGSRIEGVFSRIFHFVRYLVLFLFKAIAKILGVLFIFTGLIVLISLIFGGFISLSFLPFNVSEYIDLFFPSGADYWFSTIGLLLAIGVPFLALFLAGLVLLFNSKLPKYTGITMAAIWILGLLIATVGGVRTGFEFAKKASVNEISTLTEITSDTVLLQVLDSRSLIPKSSYSLSAHDRFTIRDGQMFTEDVYFTIRETESTHPELEIIRESQGKSYADAEKRASAIEYTHVVDSNSIKLDPYATFDTREKWRSQQVNITLYLPVGTTVFIPKSYKYLLDDVPNTHNTYDPNMVNKYWTMTDSGLVCPEIAEKILSEGKYEYDILEGHNEYGTDDSDRGNVNVEILANDSTFHIKVNENGEENTIIVNQPH